MHHVGLAAAAASLSPAATLLFAFPVRYLAYDNNEEIVALNWTHFLMFSLTDVTFANQPLDPTGSQYKQTTKG